MLNRDERVRLYSTLLRGLADEAQDSLCADNIMHDWSPWVRRMLKRDMAPILPSPDPVTCMETYRVSHHRVCNNCGKSETY